MPSPLPTSAPVATPKKRAAVRPGKAVSRRNRASSSGSSAKMSANDKPSATPAARLRYKFDTALSRGPSVVIAWLGLTTLLLILITTIIVTVFRMTGINGDTEHDLSLAESFWQSMLRVVDAGTFAGDVNWGTRIVGLGITLCGIFIAGSLIGLIANSVDQRIEELRKGRSNVLEEDHTLILGWSSRVPAIVSELVIANESRKRAAIVIVANADKTVMEEVLRESIPDMKTTRVICRSGETWLPRNLELANLHEARSIVVVDSGSDAETVKALLSIRTAQIGDETPAPVIAEIISSETARSLHALMGERLVTVCSDDIVAELTAQACRQRGLSTVFHELLDFDGDELYFAAFEELIGRTYADAQMSFEKCSVLGILGVDGTVELNPAMDRVIVAGDQLIAIAEDDSLFAVSPPTVTPVHLPSEPVVIDETKRRMVIAGWSDLGPRVISELDEFLDSNTTIELLLDPTKVDVDRVRRLVTAQNVSIEISELEGGPEVVAEHAARISFHEVIVLGYRGALDDNEADARTLLTLLAFRQVRQSEEVGPVRMVAELLDQRHSGLAEASGADDFIVSDELTSLMLAQLSERHELHQVFEDLFDREGCSIELRPAPRFGAHMATCFADVVASASELGQSAIGYRIASTGEVVVNPAKSAPLSLVRDDEILVIAPSVVLAPA